MVKTIVVAVTQIKTHPKYLKQYRVTKKFKAHDENREFHVGDKVSIIESRPLSKTKRWIVLKK
jgi:small subunit ribosomal protein S17